MIMTSTMLKKPFTIIVEGNIGAGKSTFLSNFAKLAETEIDILYEPIHKWQNVKGHNLLQLLHEDPNRWSLAFQSYAQLTMIQNHLFKSTKKAKMMERSIYSGRHCFIENLYQSGQLPASEYSVLDEWYTYLTSLDTKDRQMFNLGVDLVVYLRTEPEIAWERVKKRARSEEKTVPLKFVRDVHNLHEKWLLSKENDENRELDPAKTKEGRMSIPGKVMVIDGNRDIIENPNCFDQEFQEIKKMIENFQNEHKECLIDHSGDANVQSKCILGELNR